MASVPKLVQRFRSRELSKALSWKSTPKTTVQLQNPFIPFLNPATNRWAPPVYSRRRQANLIKAARASNTLHLLPPGPKISAKEIEASKEAMTAVASSSQTLDATLPEANTSITARAKAGFAEVHVEWVGKVKEKIIPGADIGARLYAGKKRLFKGHKWERELKKRRAKIAVRLRDMPKRIERFKSIYRRRRPNPLGRATSRKETLPF